jgi:methionine synthase II (cobalamin-independent)
MTGGTYDQKALADELHSAVGDIVKKQVALGVDVISDGELSKTSFQYYVTDRLSGLERFTPKPGVRATRENRAFPTFYKDGSHSGTQSTRYACTGPLKYVGQKQLEADIANLKAGLKGASPPMCSCRRFAVELRRPDEEPALSRRGSTLRGRRRCARNIWRPPRDSWCRSTIRGW